MYNASLEHSAILLTCIKRLLILKPCFGFFKWPLKRGYTAFVYLLAKLFLYRRMAENGFVPPPPPPREFCRHILSCRDLNAESFKRCLHSVLCGVSL